jgi:preprotein translocase subunit SecD
MNRFWTLAWALAMIGCLAVTPPTKADGDSKVSLEIRAAESAPAPGLTEATIEGTNKRIYLHAELVLVNRDIAGAVAKETIGQSPAVEIRLTNEGQKKITQLTEKHCNKPLAVLVNGKVVSAPIIRDKIEGRDMVLTGQFSLAEAERIAKALRTK